jgi:hypothetical protein
MEVVMVTIQGRLAEIELLPDQQLVDAGYMRAQNFIAIFVDGPVTIDHP